MDNAFMAILAFLAVVGSVAYLLALIIGLSRRI